MHFIREFQEITKRDVRIAGGKGASLGEMLVQGQVTPDSYVIDKRTKALLDINISEQQKMFVRRKGGNKIVLVPAKQKSRQKLDGREIRQLAELCVRVEKHYDFPCDIEWAMEKKNLYVLQSRPITTLKE